MANRMLDKDELAKAYALLKEIAARLVTALLSRQPTTAAAIRACH
jgi:hypothetical protein